MNVPILASKQTNENWEQKKSSTFLFGLFTTQAPVLMCILNDLCVVFAKIFYINLQRVNIIFLEKIKERIHRNSALEPKQQVIRYYNEPTIAQLGWIGTAPLTMPKN